MEFNQLNSEVSSSDDLSREKYWFDELGTKIFFVSLFSIVALIFVFNGKKLFKYRKLFLLSSVIVLGFILGGFLCPTSAVQNIIFKLGSAYLILFSIPLVLSLLFGRVYCGYVCPVGALSELLHVKKWRIKINDKADRIMSFIKYPVLIYLVLRIILGGEIIDTLSPFKDFFSWGGITFNFILSAVFAALSIFFYRPFCKYLCPYGAIQSIFAKFSLFGIKSKSSCVSCQLCTKNCPMNALNKKIEVNGECMLCGECASKCFKDGICVDFKLKKDKETYPKIGKENAL